MSDKQDSSWVWGDYSYMNNKVVFEMEARGGYKCKFCDSAFSQRLDVLKVHLKKCKKKSDDFDLTEITKVRIKCIHCKRPLDLQGSKLNRHLATCKNLKESNLNKVVEIYAQQHTNTFMRDEENNIDNEEEETSIQEENDDDLANEMMCIGKKYLKKRKAWEIERRQLEETITSLEKTINEMKLSKNFEMDMIQEQNRGLMEHMKVLQTQVNDIKAEKDELSTLFKEQKQKVNSLEKECADKKVTIVQLKKKVEVLMTDSGEKKLERLDLKEFKVGKVLGEGSYGKVKEIMMHDKKFAMKSMKIHPTSIIEVIALTRVQGSNLLSSSLMGCCWDEDIRNCRLLVALELCETDLRSLLPLSKKNNDLVEKIVYGSSKGLRQLKKFGIIHRDIKPENFLLSGEIVKLGDFGLAEFGTYACGNIGTPGYSAPEVINSGPRGPKYSSKVDEWSLGATLYEVCTRDFLVKDADNISECLAPKLCWKNIDKQLEKFTKKIEKLLTLSPDDRMTVEDFYKAVKRN